MTPSARAAAVAVLLLPLACGRGSRAPSPKSTPSTTVLGLGSAPRNGLEVIGWMRRAHPSRELRSLRFTLTTEFREPARATQALGYAMLPGKLRVEMLPSTSRTGDVRDRQKLTVFKAGKRISTARRVDLRTLLVFDVFAQNADTTIMWLDSARVRFGVARRDDFRGRPVWVVGAFEGDTTSSQFWVDAREWRVVRVIQRDPRDPDSLIDTRYTDFTELLEIPVPTRVEVWRDGALSEVQTLSDFTVNPSLPRKAFDLSRWRTVNAAD